MKKIINGKKYDTETAKLIGEEWHNEVGSFYCYYEELYKKRTGEFFLFGDGNCASKYPKSTFIPLSVDEAKDWAEEYLTGDEYEEIFGEVEE